MEKKRNDNRQVSYATFSDFLNSYNDRSNAYKQDNNQNKLLNDSISQVNKSRKSFSAKKSAQNKSRQNDLLAKDNEKTDTDTDTDTDHYSKFDRSIKILNPLNYQHLQEFENLTVLKQNIKNELPLLNSILQDYHHEQNNYDRLLMYFLLSVAEAISSLGETPVAAALVDSNKNICLVDFNQREINQDPLGHAEFKTIENYCRDHNTWRLDKFTLYVSLEPCIMCCGIIRQTRISKVIFACTDIKQGCVISRAKLLDIDLLSQNCSYKLIDEDISEQASQQLKKFFKKIRLRNKRIGSKSIRKKLIAENKKELL